MVNIIIFGPNGSGKGTQGAVIQKRYAIPHIETGVIFRDNMTRMTPLGMEAKNFIDRGELVPDSITVPMILDRLKEPDCNRGWLLDGFPRNTAQAEALWGALAREGIHLDAVIEIVLDRTAAKERIMGRRLCPKDNNHPNNIAIPAIKPGERDGKPVCRVCGSTGLVMRPDDQDEAAINKRHDIYYNEKTGTLGGLAFFKARMPVIQVDGAPAVEKVTAAILAAIPPP